MPPWPRTLRVLKPGGRHIFTVPLLPGVSQTHPRAQRAGDGTIVHLAPPLFHPGGDTGYFVFTEFGADLIARLERAGFEGSVAFGPPRADDLAQVFAARRPAF